MKTNTIRRLFRKSFLIFNLCFGVLLSSLNAQDFEIESLYPDEVRMCFGQEDLTIIPTASPFYSDGPFPSIVDLSFDCESLEGAACWFTYNNSNGHFTLRSQPSPGVSTIIITSRYATEYVAPDYTYEEVTAEITVVYESPVFGEYPNTTISENENIQITPDIASACVQSATAHSPSFSGDLLVDPSTGVISVTNAKQAGIYTVNVTGFDEINDTTFNRSFQLTVNASNECSTSFNELTRSGPVITNKNAVIGDFNNDGILDIANIANIVSANDGSNIRPQILLGDGEGEFNSSGTLPGFGLIALNPSSYFENIKAITSGDFNGDGNLDIAVGIRSIYSEYVYFIYGNGNGGISSMVSGIGLDSLEQVLSLASGDFNNDGILDIAVAYQEVLNNYVGKINIYFGAGNANNIFYGGVTTYTYSTSNKIPKKLISGNYNGNDQDELLVVYDHLYGFDESRETSEILQVNTSNELVPFITINASGVQAVATGDIDGQGTFDVAVLTRDGIEIFLNDNVNNQISNQFIPLDLAYNDIQVINKNGDGFLDLIISSTEEDKVTVLLGNGDGGFTQSTSVNVLNPEALTIGDFNGDSKPDCLVDNVGNSVLLGVENELALTDVNNINSVTELGTNSLKFIRITNIGDTDLVISREDLTLSGPDADLFTIIGHSSGGNANPQAGFSAVFPLRIDAGEPYKNIVVLFEPEVVGAFSAVLNISKGDCANPVATIELTGICTSDFTGDIGTYQDVTIYAGENIEIIPSGGVYEFDRLIATTNSNFDGILSVSPVDGHLMVTNPSKAGTYTVKVNGFNESDPYPTFDLVEGLGVETSLSSFASTTFELTVLDPVCSSGAFEVANIIVEDGVSNITALAIGDFNNDGKQDLITSYSNTELPDFADLYPEITPETLDGFYSSFMKLGVGNGNFGLGNEFNKYMVGLDPKSIHVDDYNGDGLHDIVAANSDAIGNTFTRISLSNLQFEPPVKFPPQDNVDSDNGNIITPIPAAYSQEVAFADFNNDGIKDLAIVNEGIVIPGVGTVLVPSSVSIQLGDGRGGITTPLTNNFEQSELIFVGNNSVSIVAGDFNEDGISDFATASASENKVSVRLGTPNDNIFMDTMGYIFEEMPDVAVGFRPSSMVLGDFNEDGIQDFAVACRGESVPLEGTFLNNGFVSIRLGNGNGGFSSADNNEVEVGLNPSSIKVGDFNGDGLQDFAVTNTFSNDVSIRFGNGDGTFYGTTQIEVGEAPVKLVVGDFNEDHIQDIAVANSDSVSVLEGIPLVNQEFELSGNGITIANNDNTPSLEDHTYFDYLLFNGDSVSRQFTIENTGETALTFVEGAITINEVESDLFSLGNISYPIFIPSGESFSFNVNFEPTFEGEKTAIVNVSAANCIENTDYNFSIKAIVVPPPVLGTYPDTEVTLGANSTIMPDSAPIYTLRAVAFTDSSFSGELLVNPATGEISVINANQSGMYEVKVKAFTINDFSTTSTFTLTVSNPENCVSELAFSTNTEFTQTGSKPSSTAIGDFNMDGIQDVIVANEESLFISIKFGNGTDGFASESTIPVPLNTTKVDVSDFDGDGYLDIAALNFTNNEVYTLLGNGDGTFQNTIASNAGLSPSALAIGDFNNDGNADIAITNILDSTVLVLLGDGTGNFVLSPEVPVGSLPRHIVLLNFNDDEFLDIATANYGDNTVSIRLGNGEGSFSGTTDIPVGQGPNYLAIGDFNQDGNQDFATANITSNTLSIALGDGLGGASVTEMSTTDSPEMINVGEFNGDGIQDLVTSSNLLTTDNLIKVYSGNGSGGFTGFSSRYLCCDLSSFKIGNFNNDGFADVIITTQTNSKVVLLFGAGAIIGVTGNSNDIVDGESAPSLVNNTDFGRVQTGETNVNTFTIKNNGNSDLEIPADAIFLTGDDEADFSISNITLPAVIRPNETFNFDIQFSPTTEGEKVATAHILSSDCITSDYEFVITGLGAAFSLPDYNSDLSANSVIAGNSLSIYPITGDLPINIVSAVAYVDYSGETNVPNFEGTFMVDAETGVLNVINAKPEGVYTVKIIGLQDLSAEARHTKTITLTVNTPICSDGTFRNTQNELNGGPGLVATEGDFNEDGIIDIVSKRENTFSEAFNGVNINLGNADGTFQNPQFIFVGSNDLEEISVSDFNGDGHQDLLTRAIGRMYLNLGSGDGSFGTSLNFPINTQLKSHVVGDFNNDGRQDIVLADNSILTCLAGNGDGTFVAITSNLFPNVTKELKAGDFDKDGNLDFIVLGKFGRIQVYRGLGNGLFSHNYANDIDIDGLSAYYAMGDFNNDAISDIAISSVDYPEESETGSFRIYFGDGNANYSYDSAIAVDYNNIRALDVGDFNGDGNQDFFINNKDFIFGEGDGTFPLIPDVITPSGIREYTTIIGDFNKDGKQDYVSLETDFQVFVGTGRLDVFSPSVENNNVYLNDGATIPSEQSNTVFKTCVNSQIAKTYTIENNSSGILTITSVSLTGDSMDSFSLDGLEDFPVDIGVNESTTFTVNFAPTAVGVVSATLNIENNDCNDQYFDFIIEGQGISPQSESTVGTYASVSMQSGGNIVVQPDIPATGAALNARAYTNSNFKGILSVNPVSGEVTITNAYPAGSYLITVETIGVCASASSTFELVVDNPACSTATFESVPVFEYDSFEFNKEVYVADFNDDGIQDVVISGGTPNPKMRIQLGNDNGTFTLHNEILFEGASFISAYYGLAIDDFNGDGHIDIVATANRRLSMYLGEGTGNFNLAEVLVVDNLTGQFAIAEDFNNDGKLDILVKEENTTTNENKLSVFLGNGIDGFSTKRDIFIDSRDVVVGDFNHDGNKDLVVASINDNKVYVLSGDGLAGFTVSTELEVNSPNALVGGDFNNDGEQDIAISTYDLVPNPDQDSPFTMIYSNQRVELYNGSSSGIFSSIPSSVLYLDDDPNSAFDNGFRMKVGDFNADGNQDLIIGYVFSSPATLPLLLGNGSGNFTLSSNIPVDSGIGNLAVGDFNADGRQDIILTALFGSESTHILFGAGAKIAVKGNDNLIEDGSTDTVSLNSTDFGETCQTLAIVKTFTIENKGFSNLELAADAITVSGGDSDQFTIGDIELPLTIARNEETTFTVTFNSDAIGVATTTVTIASNDCSSDLYNFNINATVTSEEFEPPVIECPVIESVYYTDANSCYATIILNATATDNCTLEPNLTSNTPSNNQFSVGDTTVVYTATDDNGNTATCEFIITVIDNIAPTLTCMESTTVAYGASLDPIDIGSPGVSDNCLLENISLTYTEISNQGTEGCSFYNYTINRLWTATDAVGNTDDCLQVINVVDETGPTVITQDITVVLDESGNVTITPEDIDNGSYSNCGDLTLELDITAFDINDIGENTVQLTVTDAAGNVSTASAIVTIVSETLGIEESELELDVSVYPNPTQGLLNLKLANFNVGKLSYQLFNLQGQLLFSAVISNDLTHIEMCNLSEGIYLLNLNVNDKPIKSFRIIKKE